MSTDPGAPRYASVKRFVRELRAELLAEHREAHPVIATAPGQEAQVDYGSDGPMVRHAETGKYRRMRLYRADARLPTRAARASSDGFDFDLNAKMRSSAVRVGNESDE